MNEPIPIETGRWRWWYESLADYMIAHPEARQGEMARHFQRTESTISLILNSDTFKAFYRKRRDEHAAKLDEGVRAKLFRVADSSLDNLLLSLEKKKDSVPIDILHRTTDMALKNLGYGTQPAAGSGPGNINTVVNVAVSLEDLQAAREALRRNQMTQPSPPLIDAGDAPDLPLPVAEGE